MGITYELSPNESKKNINPGGMVAIHVASLAKIGKFLINTINH